MPNEVHAHLVCDQCGTSWEIAPSELRSLTGSLAKNRAFTVNLSHLTVSGRCAACTEASHSAN